MQIVHYHPKLPMSMQLSRKKREYHTLIKCLDGEEFDLELSYMTIDTSPSSGWWIVPGTITEKDFED